MIVDRHSIIARLFMLLPKRIYHITPLYTRGYSNFVYISFRRPS